MSAKAFLIQLFNMASMRAICAKVNAMLGKFLLKVNNQTVATSELWSFVYCKANPFFAVTDTVKKKKDVVKNPPKSGIPYLEMADNINSNFSVLDRGLLSFKYLHQSKTPSVGMRILDMKGAMVHSKLLKRGRVLDDPAHRFRPIVIVPNMLYELQIIDMNGSIKKLRFKVKP